MDSTVARQDMRTIHFKFLFGIRSYWIFFKKQEKKGEFTQINAFCE